MAPILGFMAPLESINYNHGKFIGPGITRLTFYENLLGKV